MRSSRSTIAASIRRARAWTDKLTEVCKTLSGDLVLVGSSLGGYVTVAAASLLHARGAFLMAPALYLEGLPPLRERLLDCPAAIVHGWRDQVVPLEHSIRFAREYGASVHLLDERSPAASAVAIHQSTCSNTS